MHRLHMHRVEWDMSLNKSVLHEQDFSEICKGRQWVPVEHDPVGLVPALHRCWDLPGQVQQQDQGLWPSPGKQFHGRVAFYVWILWLESHMFAVAGSQKTVQMHWVIPVYCSVSQVLLCTKTINLFHLDFFCVFEAKTPFPSYLCCEENLIFSVYKDKIV